MQRPANRTAQPLAESRLAKAMPHGTEQSADALLAALERHRPTGSTTEQSADELLAALGARQQPASAAAATATATPTARAQAVSETERELDDDFAAVEDDALAQFAMRHDNTTERSADALLQRLRQHGGRDADAMADGRDGSETSIENAALEYGEEGRSSEQEWMRKVLALKAEIAQGNADLSRPVEQPQSSAPSSGRLGNERPRSAPATRHSDSADGWAPDESAMRSMARAAVNSV